MGPQVLLPEEIITVPTAITAGMTLGNAKTNMEIEGGNAYLEMLDNGVSEETARAIATGVGGVNAVLETLQLDEILKAYKVLNKAGADDAFLDIVLRELKNRGIDIAMETGQEVMQEGVTIGGTQLGSKIDTGEWAYSLTDMLKRLLDTTKESLLTFGLTNIPSVIHNVAQQSQYHNEIDGDYRGQPYTGVRNPEVDFVNGKGNSTLEKHTADHGYTSPEKYRNDAQNFLEKPPTSTTQSFVSSAGTYFRYDTATNEFGIINQYGGISTYFKPEDGLSYWLEQIQKYAPK